MALTNQKNKVSISDALMNNTPQEMLAPKPKNEAQPTEVILHNQPDQGDLVKDSEEDYTFSRENIKNLITTSNLALETMLALAQDAEHPRAYEVLAGMLKSTADMNRQLFDLQKDRKKILSNEEKKNEATAGSTTNNNIFMGTTKDLQRFLSDRDTSKTVDV
jgi:hypothetical protein